MFDEEEDDEAGFEGLRVWAKSREAAPITRTGNTTTRKIRLTARILTQRTGTEHVGAADLTRLAERSSAALAAEIVIKSRARLASFARLPDGASGQGMPIGSVRTLNVSRIHVYKMDYSLLVGELKFGPSIFAVLV